MGDLEVMGMKTSICDLVIDNISDSMYLEKPDSKKTGEAPAVTTRGQEKKQARHQAL